MSAQMAHWYTDLRTVNTLKLSFRTQGENMKRFIQEFKEFAIKAT